MIYDKIYFFTWTYRAYLVFHCMKCLVYMIFSPPVLKSPPVYTGVWLAGNIKDARQPSLWWIAWHTFLMGLLHTEWSACIWHSWPMHLSSLHDRSLLPPCKRSVLVWIHHYDSKTPALSVLCQDNSPTSSLPTSPGLRYSLVKQEEFFRHSFHQDKVEH